MSIRTHEKKLLVEGLEDKRLIPQLMEANGIPWGEKEADWVVRIDSYDGIPNILKPGVIEVELKASGLRILGVLLDANESCAARWTSLRSQCLKQFPNLPADLPKTGVIEENQDGKRFGAWLFPDNESQGMMETFLSYLVPDGQDTVWTYAQEVVLEAKNRGATFKDSHLDKANIYTWLAWCNPPGRQLHDAVIQKILDPVSPLAEPFVTWFKTLYEL